MATYQYVQNDTKPDMVFTITRKPNNTAVDLTGSTVKFKLKSNVLGTRTNDAHNTCTILSPTAGTCKYVFQTGDLANIGSHSGDLEITYADNSIETGTKAVQLNVRSEA